MRRLIPPPVPTTREARMTLKRICAWVDNLIDGIGGRCTIVWMMDLNASVRPDPDHLEAVGPIDPSETNEYNAR